jgi:hypothetical protein
MSAFKSLKKNSILPKLAVATALSCAFGAQALADSKDPLFRAHSNPKRQEAAQDVLLGAAEGAVGAALLKSYAAKGGTLTGFLSFWALADGLRRVGYGIAGFAETDENATTSVPISTLKPIKPTLAENSHLTTDASISAASAAR